MAFLVKQFIHLRHFVLYEMGTRNPKIFHLEILKIFYLEVKFNSLKGDCNMGTTISETFYFFTFGGFIS